jgi:hypothetical protein
MGIQVHVIYWGASRKEVGQGHSLSKDVCHWEPGFLLTPEEPCRVNCSKGQYPCDARRSASCILETANGEA